MESHIDSVLIVTMSLAEARALWRVLDHWCQRPTEIYAGVPPEGREALVALMRELGQCRDRR